MRLLILMAVIYFGYRALKIWLKRQVIGQGRSSHPSGGGEIEDMMVQDPQCGIYIPRQEGLPLRHAGRIHYFCSETCRDAYLSDQKADSGS